MTRWTIAAAVVAAALCSSPAASQPATDEDAVHFALMICGIFEQRAESRCEVRGKTINITDDISQREAVYRCKDITETIGEKADTFSGKGWKLRMFSHYAEQPLAVCNLY